MKRTLILGAGGHAQVVADILLRMQEAGENIYPIAFLDDNPDLFGRIFLGIPVAGKLTDVEKVSHEAVVVAIGNNRIRQQICKLLLAQGERFITARHPTAVIAPDVQLGPGSMICANAVVNTGSVIGTSVILNTGCTVDHHNQIGDFAHVAPGVHLAGDVYIGEGTLVGIGATVVPRCRIGAWGQVGAGAVVVSDLSDGVTAVGIPARAIKYKVGHE